MAPPAILETPIYRPFALGALAVTLVGATPIGAIALFRLFAAIGFVSPIWLQLHGHLQIFGFAGLLIMGVGPHLILRFSHRPLRRPASVTVTFGLVVLGIGGRIVATVVGRSAVGFLLVSGMAETLAFTIFAVWVTAQVRVAEPRFPSDWLMVTGAWWFAAALAIETAGLTWATATGHDPAVASPGPGLHAMSLYGGIFGWILGVAVRAVPMFIPGRRVGRLGGPVLAGLNGGVLLALAAGIWPAGSRPT
ncbi:MAG TPA: hypothetical protein VN648_12640, partial [Candidatus Methylomirabilis sp.]|nr:hypothetical protein [Candidatus Methylomirabilis sp.]